MAVTNSEGTQDVFDVANWLDRANGRAATPAPVPGESTPPPSHTPPRSYEPRHRADVPVDSVA
jgi:hypothetical protein